MSALNLFDGSDEETERLKGHDSDVHLNTMLAYF